MTPYLLTVILPFEPEMVRRNRYQHMRMGDCQELHGPLAGWPFFAAVAFHGVFYKGSKSPRAMCAELKSRLLVDGALSISGIEEMTVAELDIHFVKRNPPFARSILSSSDSCTDLRQSST